MRSDPFRSLGGRPAPGPSRRAPGIGRLASFSDNVTKEKKLNYRNNRPSNQGRYDRTSELFQRTGLRKFRAYANQRVRSFRQCDSRKERTDKSQEPADNDVERVFRYNCNCCPNDKSKYERKDNKSPFLMQPFFVNRATQPFHYRTLNTLDPRGLAFGVHANSRILIQIDIQAPALEFWPPPLGRINRFCTSVVNIESEVDPVHKVVSEGKLFEYVFEIGVFRRVSNATLGEGFHCKVPLGGSVSCVESLWGTCKQVKTVPPGGVHLGKKDSNRLEHGKSSFHVHVSLLADNSGLALPRPGLVRRTQTGRIA